MTSMLYVMIVQSGNNKKEKQFALNGTLSLDVKLP